MSAPDNINYFKELACIAAEVVMGSYLYYTALNAWYGLEDVSYKLNRLSRVKEVSVSDLRSLISSESGESQSETSKKMFVAVRGITKLHTSNDSTFDDLVSEATQQKCVILEQTWDSWPKGKPITTVDSRPFVLSGSGQGEHSSQVLVKLEGSEYSLPPQLRVVFDLYDDSISRTIPCPVRYGVRPEYLVEEKILPVGKKITAVGMCSLQDGNLQIEACKSLPFLAEWTKTEIIEWLHYLENKYYRWMIYPGLLSLLLFGCCAIQGVRLRKKSRKVKGK